MGGINHQPCNRPKTAYLRFSTLMSRALSNARAEFEKGNVCLEDVLLRETTHRFGTGTLADAIRSLNNSRRFLHDVQLAAHLLRKNMQENKFEDLHKQLGIDLSGITAELREAGIASGPKLDSVATVLSSGGFYAVLDVFVEFTKELRADIDALAKGLTLLTGAESSGTVTDILEGNLPGNIRVEFARTYSRFNRFQEFFLASSAISTDVWYRWINAGTLAGGPVPRAQAVA